MIPSHCNIYGKSISERNSVKYNLCQTQISYVDALHIKYSNKTSCCIKCTESLFPLSETTGNFFLFSAMISADRDDTCLVLSCLSKKINCYSSKDINNSKNTFKPKDHELTET